MSADLPILWEDKENSPELEAFLAQFGTKYYFTAEEINQLKRAVNEMAVIQQSTFMGTAEPADTPTGTGNRYWTAVSPGTYTNFGGVVVSANSLAIISVTAAGAWSVSQTVFDLTEYAKNTNIEAIYADLTIPITPTYNSGYLIPNYLWPEANANYRIVQYPVAAGKTYRLKSQLTTGAGNGAGIYCFYTTINNPLDGGLTLQAANEVKSYDVHILIPSTVTYLMVTEKLTGGDFSELSEVVSTPVLKEYIDNKTASLQDAFDSITLVDEASYSGIVLWMYNNAIANAAYTSSFHPVTAGKKYRIKGQFTTPDADNANIAVYSFYTSAAYGSGINGTLFNQKTTVANYDKIITAPENANFIGLSQKTGIDTIVITEFIQSSELQIDLETAKSDIISNETLSENNFNIVSKVITPVFRNGYVIPNYLWEEADVNYKVAKYAVEVGKSYRLRAQITARNGSGFAMGAYCWYQSLEVPKDGGLTTIPELTTQIYDVVLTAPSGATYLNISQKLTGSDYNSLDEIIESEKLQEDLSKVSSKNITCWGDSITWGAAPEDGNYWTKLLQNLLGINYNVINCGVGGESAGNIPSRQGAMPMYNSVEYTLPAGTTLVPVGRYDAWFYSGFFKSTYDDVFNSFLLQGEGRDFNTINPCFVDGIECTLSYVSESTSPTAGQYYIKRNVAGTARVIKIGTPVYTNAAKNLNQQATVIFIGTNDGWVDTADLIARYKKMIDFANVGRKYVVIGIYGGTAQNNHSLNKAAYELMEKEFSKHFGLNYINLRKYAVEHGLADAGITPTTPDTDAIALGFCPPSLIPDGIHPNAAFSVEIAQLVFQTLKQLGV